jgi:hypothetical protein
MFAYCAGQTVRYNRIVGPDLEDADNIPRADIRWGKGVVAASSMHTVFVGNECRNLRRGVDATAFTTSIMPCWTTNSHNTYHDCKEIVGGHQSRHYTAVGNTGRADSLGALRSTDNTIIGNRVQCLVERACLTIGSANTGSYSDEPPLGRNIIKDNYAIGALMTEGVQLEGHSLASLDASGNVWGKLDGGEGYAFYVKEIENIRIKDHLVGTPEADGTATSTMALVADTTDVPVSVFDGFDVDFTTEGWFDTEVDFSDIASYDNWWINGVQEVTGGSNGDYIKFKDGRLICTHELTLNAPNTANGQIYGGSSSTSWTFPEAFASGTIPVVSGADQNVGELLLSYFCSSNTAASFRALRATSSAVAPDITVRAEGKWK